MIAQPPVFIEVIGMVPFDSFCQISESCRTVPADSESCRTVPADSELYYAIRELYNKKIAAKAFDAECAALMIWINKHCFNGLYRVNSRGLFNVPYNNKVNGRSIDEDNIRAISEYLRQSDITITCLDFERTCDGVTTMLAYEKMTA